MNTAANNWQRAVVVGLGKTGYSVAQHLPSLEHLVTVLTGTAVVSNDRAKIKELFSTPAKAWWESADDPNIRVLAPGGRAVIVGDLAAFDVLVEELVGELPVGAQFRQSIAQVLERVRRAHEP